MRRCSTGPVSELSLIHISYEDENGLTTEVEKEMLLFVNEPIDELGGMEAGNMGVDGMGRGSGMNGADGEQTFFNRYKKVILSLIHI